MSLRSIIKECETCGKSFRTYQSRERKYCSVGCYRAITPIERFMEKVTISDSGCWNWTGSKNEKGYGMFGHNGKVVKAHKFIYELHNGPVPDSLELDHSCDNRGCVNHSHIRPMPHRDNVLRGRSPIANNSRKTHCKRGHELSGGNVRITTSRYGHPSRYCMVCERIHGANRRMRDAQL